MYTLVCVVFFRPFHFGEVCTLTANIHNFVNKSDDYECSSPFPLPQLYRTVIHSIRPNYSTPAPYFEGKAFRTDNQKLFDKQVRVTRMEGMLQTELSSSMMREKEKERTSILKSGAYSRMAELIRGAAVIRNCL